MNSVKATGLGQPELIGKKSLFQPPISTPIPPLSEKRVISKERSTPVKPEEPTPRLRITTDLTKHAMETIQTLHEHRIRTGKTLPAWKIISEALELYEKLKKGEGSEKQKSNSS